LTEAVAVLEKDPDEWGETAIALTNLGVLHFRQKNNAEAERLLLRSLATMEQHLGPDHPMLTRTLSSLASLASVAGRRDEAGERLRRALDIAERRLGEDHPVYGAILGSYAAFLRQGGEKSRAKAMEARSSQILKDSVRRNGLGGVIDISSLRRK
jgi:Tfp pilus assembly protein PilF